MFSRRRVRGLGAQVALTAKRMLVHAQTRDRQGLGYRYPCSSTLNFIRAQEKEVTIALTGLSVHVLKLDRAGREGRGETGDPGTVINNARLLNVTQYANCQPVKSAVRVLELVTGTAIQTEVVVTRVRE